jgi:hypothetical protein
MSWGEMFLVTGGQFSDIPLWMIITSRLQASAEITSQTLEGTMKRGAGGNQTCFRVQNTQFTRQTLQGLPLREKLHKLPNLPLPRLRPLDRLDPPQKAISIPFGNRSEELLRLGIGCE